MRPLASLYLSKCLSACFSEAATGRIFVKFDVQDFYKTLLRNYRFDSNRTKIRGTLHHTEYMKVKYLPHCKL